MINGTRAIYGIYTITPLHMGTGQATGAVDLPVAREQHTGLPVIPATSIKGVVRDILEGFLKKDPSLSKNINEFLGPEIDKQDGLHAGGLIFTEGQTLAIPFRSMNQPFFFVTSLLVLERFDRNLRAFGIEKALPLHKFSGELEADKVYVSDEKLHGQMLVIEDSIFKGEEVFFSPTLKEIASKLKRLLPERERENGTGLRFETSLIVLPDREFLDLVSRCLPVQARIKLTGGKTASKWKTPEGKIEKGNLWYEEAVPADSLFAFFIMNRPGVRDGKDLVGDFQRFLADHDVNLSVVQMGGNETVGYGWCWWNGLFSNAPGKADSGGEK